MCSTGGQSHGCQRIILVRRKGEPTYPNIQQQQQNTTLTDCHPPSSIHPSTVLPSNMLPTLTTTSGPHQAAPIIQMIESHSSSLAISNNPSLISSDIEDQMRQQQCRFFADLAKLERNFLHAQ